MVTRRSPPTHSDRLPDAGDSDELSDVLADPHGRTAVVYLSRRDDPVTLAELARGVVGLLRDEPPDSVDEHVARRVQTWLHHGHLPVLHRHGIVAYESDAGVVELTDASRAAGDRALAPPRYRRRE